MITLPVTCTQLQWIILIGFPLMVIIGIIFHESSTMILGMIFTAFAWVMRIAMWAEDGKIKCKCDKK